MAKREAQGPLGYPLQVLARSSLWAFRYPLPMPAHRFLPLITIFFQNKDDLYRIKK
jgi:hypothetical protein